ncbi:MAG: PIN domain-containing protein [Candidatus Lokiarchaeota archaeon]|nr:PIN domain-containing protein [Candidatus Harpocratesius repetitus]
MSEILIDTGIILNLLTKNPPQKLKTLIKNIQDQRYKTATIQPIILEVSRWLIKSKKKLDIQEIIFSLLKSYNIEVYAITELSYFISAGILMHQIPQLSTVDALLYIYGKEIGASIHTTDKSMVEGIKEKFPKSKIQYYKYSK